MKPNEGMKFGNFIRKIEKIDPESETSKVANRSLTKMYKALVEGDEWPTKEMVNAFSWLDMVDALGKDRSEVSRFSTMVHEDPRNDVENLLMLREVARYSVSTRQDLRGHLLSEELIGLLATYYGMTATHAWSVPPAPSGVRYRLGNAQDAIDEAYEVHN